MFSIDEPSVVYVEQPRDERPSYDELLDANEALARKVSLQATEIQMLQSEVTALKRLLVG